MKTPKPKHVLRQLREFLRLQQKEFVNRVGMNLELLKSIELGRRELTESTAQVIVDKTGVSREWLLANNPALPIMDVYGKPYEHVIFPQAPSLDYNAYLSRVGIMELLQAYALLAMLKEAELIEAETKRAYPITSLRTRLEKFMREEIRRFPDVRNRINKGRSDFLRQRTKMGKLTPAIGFLYPWDPGIFDLIIRDAKQCKRAHTLYWKALDEVKPELKHSPEKKPRLWELRTVRSTRTLPPAPR
jgi:transcriptional regulator with XRE-family HTH domain